MRGNFIKDIGELGLVDRIRKKEKPGSSVIKGIGDDCAVLEFSKDKYMLFACDMLIEGRHFLLKGKDKGQIATAYQIGHKAMAVNISDVAAMGGVPKHALVSIGLPRNLKIDFLDQLYKGIRDVSGKFHVNIVGGDANECDKVVIDVSIIGFVEKNKLVTRSNAKAGDSIFVTGRLGGSRHGKHLNFTPRLAEARYLVENFKINSMIDISDGLAIDLYRLLKESKRGAYLFANFIPLSESAKNLNSALSDGEDFELLFTVSQKEARRLTSAGGRRRKFNFTRIGVIADGDAGMNILYKDKVLPLEPTGYAHF